MTPANLHDLADELDGHIVDTDSGKALALAAGGVIYANFRWEIRLARFGLPVVTLGTRSDGVAAIVAAYRATVQAAAS